MRLQTTLSHSSQQQPTHLHSQVEVKSALTLPIDLAPGWYWVTDSKSLKYGHKPKRISVFGQEFLIWRGSGSGSAIHLTSVFCPHEGVDLSKAKIHGDCITCPMHHWRFSASQNGECVEIPGQQSIPQTARLEVFSAQYQLQERYGLVWAWYGSAEPQWELPDYPAVEADKEQFMTIRYLYRIRNIPRRILENPLDFAHLTASVHKVAAEKAELTLLDNNNSSTGSTTGDSASAAAVSAFGLNKLPMPISEFDAWFSAILKLDLKRFLGLAGFALKVLKINVQTFTLRLDTTPSLQVVTALINGRPTFRTLSVTKPVSRHWTEQYVIFSVNRSGSRYRDLVNLVLFGIQTLQSGAQDVPYWDSMREEGGTGEAYSKQDFGVLKYRQFYKDWLARKSV